MVNISQNVNIEMLEKLPDGTYKRKYPKTRADDGTTFDEHLADYTQYKDEAPKDIRADSTTALRTEVVNSLPTEANKGQIVFLDDTEEPSFKGYNGGEWV